MTDITPKPTLDPSIVLCNLCGSTRYVLVHEDKKKTYKAPVKSGYAISESHLEKPEKIVRCMSCHLVYAIPKESLQAIRKDYESMVDPEYLAEEKGRRAQARSILDLIARYKNVGTILDIGCGPAFFLDEAKKSGWQAQGVDLSGWSKDYAQKSFGISVTKGSLDEAHFPGRTFDVVVMNDFIEHVENPSAVLTEVRRILKNDGVIYLSTPDINSFLSRLLKAKWWGINKYHLFYFSRITLEKMFHQVGFKSVKYSPYPRIFSWSYWVTRLKAYPAWISIIPSLFSQLSFVQNMQFKVILHDQIGVIAKKTSRLDSLVTDEIKDEKPVNPMKVIVVLPAYNAEKTLARTVADIPRNVVQEIILVDDKSTDRTVQIARELGLTVFEHDRNRGYGANQKTCYQKALEMGADVAVMCHPDYQYDPRTIGQLVEPILKGKADAVFGSRMMKGGALEGGMPLWKHNANILLTAFENVVLGTYLSEYHSGFRAYSAHALRQIHFDRNADGFIFDTEIIVQLHVQHLKIEEIPIRTRYFEEASSIKIWPSILYGLGIIRVMAEYTLLMCGVWKNKKYERHLP